MLCFWFLSIPPTLTMINQFSFCVVYPWWVILNFKINESYKTFDSNKSFRFCLNTLDIRPGGIPFGHPLGLGWLFQTVVSTLTESNFFSFCVSYPYWVKLVFIPCGVPLLSILSNVGGCMMLKFLKPTAKNQFQRRTPTYYYY